ncbi:MAG: hypothetical protein GX496_09110 [Firmicutes bacterium]|nr:hypothetical protein [Bacillota bacterium]
MLNSVARFIASTQVAWVSFVAILTWGAERYWTLVLQASHRLRSELEPLLRRLDALQRQAEPGAPGQARLDPTALEQLDEAFPASGALRQAWEEFRATLVEYDGRVWRTASAHAFFGADRILGAYFNLRHIGVTPNTLTGLGILGTFVGLVAGIHLGHQGLLLDRIDQMRASLFDLLAGASTAFLTSVAGLLASLLFGWFSRKKLNEQAELTSRLASALAAGIGLRPAEWVVADALGELRKQTAELRHFNTDLSTSIGAALDERLAAHLVPHLQAVISAVDRLREEQVMFNQETLGQLLGRFSEQLAQFAGREMDALAEAIRDARATLVEASQSLAQERANVAESWSNGLAHFEAGLRALQDQIAAAGAPLMEAANRWSEHLRRAEELLKQAAETADGVRVALDGASRAVREAAEGLTTGTEALQATLKNASRLIEPSEGAARRVQDAVSELQQMGNSLAQATTALRLQIQAVTSAWESQRERFEGLDEALGDAFARFTSGMQDALDRASAILGEAHDHLSEALQGLRSFVQDVDALVNEVADILQSIHPAMRGVSDGAGR